MTQQSTLPASAATRTSRLLACGIVAGPLFPAVGMGRAMGPGRDGVSVRLVVASAVLYGYVGALAAHLLRRRPPDGPASG